jgi:hypothetical protein
MELARMQAEQAARAEQADTADTPSDGDSDPV